MLRKGVSKTELLYNVHTCWVELEKMNLKILLQYKKVMLYLFYGKSLKWKHLKMDTNGQPKISRIYEEGSVCMYKKIEVITRWKYKRWS